MCFCLSFLSDRSIYDFLYVFVYVVDHLTCSPRNLIRTALVTFAIADTRQVECDLRCFPDIEEFRTAQWYGIVRDPTLSPHLAKVCPPAIQSSPRACHRPFPMLNLTFFLNRSPHVYRTQVSTTESMCSLAMLVMEYGVEPILSGDEMKSQ